LNEPPRSSLGWRCRSARSQRWNVKTVLVVEDDSAILELLGSVLSDAGYRPVLLSTSDDVSRKVAVEKPDLILLDILLQPRHGMGVLASLEEMDAHPPIIMMSAAVRGVREMGRIARALGAADFVEKPFDIADLLSRVESVLGATAA
jgi:DNA-binding response OmpR family regulator